MFEAKVTFITSGIVSFQTKRVGIYMSPKFALMYVLASATHVWKVRIPDFPSKFSYQAYHIIGHMGICHCTFADVV